MGVDRLARSTPWACPVATVGRRSPHHSHRCVLTFGHVFVCHREAHAKCPSAAISRMASLLYITTLAGWLGRTRASVPPGRSALTVPLALRSTRRAGRPGLGALGGDPDRRVACALGLELLDGFDEGERALPRRRFCREL